MEGSRQDGELSMLATCDWLAPAVGLLVLVACLGGAVLGFWFGWRCLRPSTPLVQAMVELPSEDDHGEDSMPRPASERTADDEDFGDDHLG